MTLNQDQFIDSPQRLASSCERRIGLTRLTETTIEEGPDALMDKSFNYLITEFVDNFEIHESLDASFRTATIIMSDPINWRNVAPLTGNEIISIAYKNALTASDSKEKILHFRVLNVREEPTNNSLESGYKRLIINLVEFPAFNFLTSNQYYKTYNIDADNTPNLKLSDIVGDMLDNIKHFKKWYDVDIEESTKNSIHFYVPNWIPLKVINYCKKYAVSDIKKYSNYVFHIGNVPNNPKPVAYFKPVFSFIDKYNKFRAYGTSFQDVNKDDIIQANTPEYGPLDVIQTYSFQYYDARKTNTFSGNTEFIFDYIDDNEYICTDYKNFIERNYKSINPYIMYPSAYGNQWSSFYRSAWNKKEGEILIKNELFNEYSRNIINGGLYCEAMTSIFEGRTVGERAELIFNIKDTDKEFDEMLSGGWLTWSIEDRFVMGKCFSSVKFVNDSFVNISDPSHTMKAINTITTDRSPDTIEA